MEGHLNWKVYMGHFGNFFMHRDCHLYIFIKYLCVQHCFKNCKSEHKTAINGAYNRREINKSRDIKSARIK